MVYFVSSILRNKLTVAWFSKPTRGVGTSGQTIIGFGVALERSSDVLIFSRLQASGLT